MSDSDADPEYAWECENCLAATTEHGPCRACGALPFEGDGWRIECQECGAVEFGDQGQSVDHDKRMHRWNNCPGANFEVTSL